MDKIEPKSAGFDPLEQATLAAQVVCWGDRRKYYRYFNGFENAIYTL